MVRPRSSSKVAKQRGGSDSGKRKRGGVPNAGGGGGRPAKQSRREGKAKPVDRDVYEAEDSDPDEVKHAERFDKVDNYEYELPSDFEDEEIDEDLAFTEEDKKKFGGWFEKEVDADEDEDGGAGIGDDGDSDWDDDEDKDGEEGGDDDDDDDGDRGPRHRGKAGARTSKGADDEDDLFLGGDDDDDDDDNDELEAFGEDDEDGDDVEDDEDDDRHRSMLRAVLAATSAEGGTDGGRKRFRRDPNAAVVSEAYPESEYNLNPGSASAGGAAGALSVADLLKGLTSDERRKLGSARRLLEKVAGAGPAAGGDGKAVGKGLRPVAVPLPAVVAERQERKAGYEAASEEVAKWQSIVKANREAPTLRLISGRDEVPRVTTTAALVAQHTPSADNALEAEVAALLEAAGAANTEALEEAEEKLALKALSLEEAKERRNRLAKMRALLFYHEVKARRLKAIKSKEYHRHLARAAKRKAAKLAAAAAEAGEGGDGEPGKVDAERAAAIEAEYQRAKERLTQRHRNSSRWARRVLKRGQMQIDEGTKAALAEQLQLGQQLKRKIEGRRGDGSDSEGDDDSDAGSTSASEGEEGAAAARQPGARVRSAALELLAGGGAALELEGDNAPKKGLLALPFMKRAMERRRLAAQQEAEQLLRELDEQQALAKAEDNEDQNGDAAAAAAVAGSGGGPGRLIEALVGYGVPTGAAEVSGAGGRRRFGGGGGSGAAAAAADADDNDEADVESDDAEDADAKAERLGRKPRGAAAAAAPATTAAGAGKKGRKAGTAAAATAPPTAADEADLDAAIAAGAAGRGLLVSSSVLVDAAADEDLERRNSGRHASTRAAAAAATANGGGNILRDVAALKGSMAAGGGRAALFKGPAAADAAAAPAYVAAKKFEGAKPCYVFKKGPQGLGYYRDGAAAAAAASGAAGEQGGKGKGRQQQQQRQQKQGKGAAGAAGTPVAVAGQPKPVAQQEAGQKQPRQRDGHAQQQQKAAAAAAAASGARAGAGAGAGANNGGAGGDRVDDDDDDDDDNTPMIRPMGAGQQQLQQRDLIRQAFAGDDVEAEFAAEKAAAVAEEMPHVEEPSALPGWGAWAAQQRNPKWMQVAKDKAAKIRADAAASRKDANLKYVVISEKYDKKAVKYTTPAAPFPFTSQEAYERSLRQPLGREYNPDAAFRDLTRPAVLKQAGVTIAPLRFSEPMAKELGRRSKKAEAEREARRVVTVAGGMIKKGKAAQ